eukprot:GHVT01007480.1.p1 GENE.GHVT01007480.1~~GHVT01007480.1.p1  ORF type:complete len:303 (+),score=93.91 GHVT01007480.1:308-1216(+)
MNQIPGTAGGGEDVDYSTMKVGDIRELLSQRALPTNGKKSELIERLEQNDTEIMQASASSSVSSSSAEGIADASPKAGEGEEVPAINSPSSSSSPSASSAPTASAVAASEAKKAAQQNERASGSTAVDLDALTEEEKIERRKKMFGVVSDKDRLSARANRFGIVTAEAEEDKRKKRSERFDTNPSNASGQADYKHTFSGIGAIAKDEEEINKRDKRKARFGIVEESEQLAKRAARFGVVKEGEKLNQRRLRFAMGAPEATNEVAARLEDRRKRFASPSSQISAPTNAAPTSALEGENESTKN